MIVYFNIIKLKNMKKEHKKNSAKFKTFFKPTLKNADWLSITAIRLTEHLIWLNILGLPYSFYNTKYNFILHISNVKIFGRNIYYLNLFLFWLKMINNEFGFKPLISFQRNIVENHSARGSPKKQPLPKASTAQARPKSTKKCSPKLGNASSTEKLRSDLLLAEQSSHEPKQWSRDEDKIVLEAIKNGFSSEDDLVQQLEQNDDLNDRTGDEIRERFTFLMDVILNLWRPDILNWNEM